MSRAAEERYEKWAKQHALDCERDLVVGAKVWRVHYSQIQEGVVIRVARCKLVNGDPRECADGDHPYYVAQFNHDYTYQTWQWVFFSKPEYARHKLADRLQGQITEAHREIETLKRRIEEVVAEGTEAVETR